VRHLVDETGDDHVARLKKSEEPRRETEQDAESAEIFGYRNDQLKPSGDPGHRPVIQPRRGLRELRVSVDEEARAGRDPKQQQRERNAAIGNR
jgi:hypothetical protein